jgi:transposase-like protein
MNKCPKCNSNVITKSGIVKDKQRYKCKFCNFNFTVEHIGKSDNKKRDALFCFLTGLDYRTTGKLLNVNHVTTFNWIKQFGEQLEKLKIEKVKESGYNTLQEYIIRAKEQTGHGIILIDINQESTTIIYTKQ